MVRARQCDRCKGFYQVEFEPKYRVTKISNTASRYTKSQDLCPECAEELRKWYEEFNNAKD